MLWSLSCVEHVLSYLDESYQVFLQELMKTARGWIEGSVTVGEAREASMRAVIEARSITDTTTCLVVRAGGHMVATAHMADHAITAGNYALKAIKASTGSPVEDERVWQNDQLPDPIKSLVLSSR